MLRHIAAAVSLIAIAGPVGAQTFPGKDYVVHNFKFESGETLPELRLHYIAMGQPRRDASGVVRNAVIVLHGTTGSGNGFTSRTFAGVLFGPGELLDTSKYFVVLPDGVGHGNSGKPSDGMRTRFPKYTYNDMVDAQHELLTKGLGVNHLRLVMGTSMGCMHAWVWGERYPTFVDGLVPLACAPTQIAGRNRMMRTMLMDAIRNDPGYDGGNYASQPAGLRHSMFAISSPFTVIFFAMPWQRNPGGTAGTPASVWPSTRFVANFLSSEERTGAMHVPVSGSETRGLLAFSLFAPVAMMR